MANETPQQFAAAANVTLGSITAHVRSLHQQIEANLPDIRWGFDNGYRDGPFSLSRQSIHWDQRRVEQLLDDTRYFLSEAKSA